MVTGAVWEGRPSESAQLYSLCPSSAAASRSSACFLPILKAVCVDAFSSEDYQGLSQAEAARIVMLHSKHLALASM